MPIASENKGIMLYNPAFTYSVNDMCYYQGVVYTSVVNNNRNSVPNPASPDWSFEKSLDMNTANELAILPNKLSPKPADRILIESAEDNFQKKHTSLNLLALSSKADMLFERTAMDNETSSIDAITDNGRLIVTRTHDITSTYTPDSNTLFLYQANNPASLVDESSVARSLTNVNNVGFNNVNNMEGTYSLEFTNTSQNYLSISPAVGLSFAGPFTWEANVYLKSNTTTCNLFGNLQLGNVGVNVTGPSIGFGIRSANSFELTIAGQTTNSPNLSLVVPFKNGTLPLNTPHHIAIIRDSNNDIKFYLDFKLEYIEPNQPGLIELDPTATSYIGYAPAANGSTGSALYADALIDRIRLSNVVRPVYNTYKLSNRNISEIPDQSLAALGQVYGKTGWENPASGNLQFPLNEDMVQGDVFRFLNNAGTTEIAKIVSAMSAIGAPADVYNGIVANGYLGLIETGVTNKYAVGRGWANDTNNSNNPHIVTVDNTLNSIIVSNNTGTAYTLVSNGYDPIANKTILYDNGVGYAVARLVKYDPVSTTMINLGTAGLSGIENRLYNASIVWISHLNKLAIFLPRSGWDHGPMKYTVATITGNTVSLTPLVSLNRMSFMTNPYLAVAYSDVSSKVLIQYDYHDYNPPIGHTLLFVDNFTETSATTTEMYDPLGFGSNSYHKGDYDTSYIGNDIFLCATKSPSSNTITVYTVLGSDTTPIAYNSNIVNTHVTASITMTQLDTTHGLLIQNVTGIGIYASLITLTGLTWVVDSTELIVAGATGSDVSMDIKYNPISNKAVLLYYNTAGVPTAVVYQPPIVVHYYNQSKGILLETKLAGQLGKVALSDELASFYTGKTPYDIGYIQPTGQIDTLSTNYPFGKFISDHEFQVEEYALRYSNLDNTRDLDKPISTATQTALDTKVKIPVVINDITTARTSSLADVDAYVRFNNAAAITVTLPDDATVAFPQGSVLLYSQRGTGVITLTPAIGVIVNSGFGLTTAAVNTIKLFKIGPNEWDRV